MAGRTVPLPARGLPVQAPSRALLYSLEVARSVAADLAAHTGRRAPQATAARAYHRVVCRRATEGAINVHASVI